MEIVSASENIIEFKKFLKSLLKDIDYNYIYDIEAMLELKDYKDFILFTENGKIIDFANLYNQGFNFISPNFTDYKKQLEELEIIKKIYPDYILESSDTLLNPEQDIYYKCKFDSRINSNFKYNIDNGVNYYVADKKLIYLLRNNFENNYFKKLNLNNISFVNIRCNELKTFLEKYSKGVNTWTDGNEWALAGFHYFNLEDDKQGQLLICLNDDNILGVIKHGVYDEYDTIFHCICYIDVNFAYRNKGISKLLMRQMNAHMIDGLPLVVTDESEMGRKCHMHKLLKKNINKRIYTYKELENMQYERLSPQIKNPER